MLSGVTSLEVQAGNDGASSVDGGGGSKAGGGGGGGGRGRGGGGGAGRHGWKPLHLGSPFATRAEGSNFRVSTLSKDFVLQRFFFFSGENLRGSTMYKSSGPTSVDDR